MRHSLGPDLDLMRGVPKVGRNILRGIFDNVTGISHVDDEVVCRARYLVDGIVEVGCHPILHGGNALAYQLKEP